MGLSASQARLLSITARISDNELHSQQIANSKVRLADKTQEASREYIEALSASKLVYTTYDAKGNATQTALTPALIYEYSDLKNQYGISNTSGQLLVTSTDASNYEKTDTLLDFLGCYDLLTEEKYSHAMEQYNEDMAKYNLDLAKYNQDIIEYNEKLNTYQTNLDEYNQQLEKYNADYEKYQQTLNEPNLYDTFAGFVGTSDNPNGNAGQCYMRALNGDSGCYKHLLAHLLDYKSNYTFNTNYDYTTSYTNPETGEKATTKIESATGSYMASFVNNSSEWLGIVDAINDTTRICDGDDNYTGNDDTTKDNIIQQAIDAGRVPTQKEILMSDYLYDETTNSVSGVKTLKQKAIDLLYILNNLNTNGLTFSSEEMKASLINFTDGDMQNLATAPVPPDPFTGIEPEMPPKPTEPRKPEYSIELNDQNKAQWYVNLWYMMNGSDTANLVKKDFETDLSSIFIVEAVEKSPKGNYKVLDENLTKSSEWLQFALEHGVVTLYQAQYSNFAEDSGKAVEISSRGITWTATNYGSCIDISSVEDEVAIAKAEAEYTKKVNEIQAKDKKYDNDIKKLDTEHNALQTEYDSVKEVINKNVERSFKAFS